MGFKRCWEWNSPAKNIKHLNIYLFFASSLENLKKNPEFSGKTRLFNFGGRFLSFKKDVTNRNHSHLIFFSLQIIYCWNLRTKAYKLKITDLTTYSYVFRNQFLLLWGALSPKYFFFLIFSIFSHKNALLSRHIPVYCWSTFRLLRISSSLSGRNA